MAVTTSKQETQAIPAGRWQVDPAHSSVEFRVKHMMIATVKGRFTQFEGVLEAGEDRSVQARGTVQAASIDTQEPRRDEHLRSPDFFDVATYPEISFLSTDILSTGDAGLRVKGELTIHGVTKPRRADRACSGRRCRPLGKPARRARGIWRDQPRAVRPDLEPGARCRRRPGLRSGRDRGGCVSRQGGCYERCLIPERALTGLCCLSIAGRTSTGRRSSSRRSCDVGQVGQVSGGP